MADRSDDDVVRDYLRFIADPGSVQPDLGDIDERIDAATDPLERVKLRSERTRLQDVGPRLEAAFVRTIPGWASAHEVGVDALLEEGVPRRVLSEAGLVRGTPRKATERTSRSTSAGAGTASRGGSGATRVTADTLTDYVRNLRADTTVTTATLGNDVGGSAGTIRKVLDALLEDGTIVEDGKDHSGPGRPRVLYRKR